MPRALYVLIALIAFFSFIFNDHLTKDISGFVTPIFTEFSLYGRYLIVNCRFDALFSIAQGTVSWQLILGLKYAKSVDSPSFVALAFLHGVGYRNSDFNRFICDDLATSCKNW